MVVTQNQSDKIKKKINIRAMYWYLFVRNVFISTEFATEKTHFNWFDQYIMNTCIEISHCNKYSYYMLIIFFNV
jgi:hypothetical protein